MTAPREPYVDMPVIDSVTQPHDTPMGRPKKYPDMPELGLNEAEQGLFDGFISDFLRAYPDINQADYRLLWMAGTRYIAGLRLIRYEMTSGRTISMARQHPLVEMRALLDQLSVTRRARTKTSKEDDPDAKELQSVLLALGRKP